MQSGPVANEDEDRDDACVAYRCRVMMRGLGEIDVNPPGRLLHLDSAAR
jgi:hypothetical protein